MQVPFVVENKFKITGINDLSSQNITEQARCQLCLVSLCLPNMILIIKKMKDKTTRYKCLIYLLL